MANEITVGVALNVSKGLLALARQVQGLQISMAGDALMHGVQTIGTSKENVQLGEVSAPGIVLLRNLDAANYVELGEDADSPFVRLEAREVALFRMAGTTLSAKAHTAAVLLEYIVLSA